MVLGVLGICEDPRTQWCGEGPTCAAGLGGGQKAVFGHDFQLGGPEACDSSGGARLELQSLGLGQGLRDSRCVHSFSGRKL